MGTQPSCLPSQGGAALLRTLLCAMLVAAAPLSGRAQSTDPDWLDRLTRQLAAERDCAVEYYVNIGESPLAGRMTFHARAQCADGRQFDATLIEPAESFSLSECGVQIC